MFNFFDEIKSGMDNALPQGIEKYNIVNISGRILYVEGHRGITTLSKSNITFKVKGGRIVVEGKDMIMAELTENTLKIVGNIIKIEAF